MKTTAEWQAIKRQRPFTREERQTLFGDPSLNRNDEHENELVRRLDAGLPLSKGDTIRARRIKRNANTDRRTA
jgi:hypothetical protein